MGLSFLNPWGALALLGIPAVLLIHILQRRMRKVRVSTLFLLRQYEPKSLSGGRIERIRQSLPLWMQILCVLVLTWLLMQPAWLREDSRTKVAIVLDSSASMGVFTKELSSGMDDLLVRVGRTATRVDFTLLPSDEVTGPLYSGDEPDALKKVLTTWKPVLGEHSFLPRLRLARMMVGAEGRVILVTDHPVPVPEGVEILSIGSPRENVGWAGSRLLEQSGARHWQAIARNYGMTPQKRTLQICDAGGKVLEKQDFSILPGQALQLGGVFPNNAERLLLKLDADDFSLDDELPLLWPKLKSVRMMVAVPIEFQNLVDRLIHAIPQTESSTSSEEVDVNVTAVNVAQPDWPKGPAIIFIQNAVSEGTKPQFLAVSAHPLMNGLNWNPLQENGATGVPIGANDEGLLWRGKSALIFLRQTGRGQQLVLNFDVLRSNAARLGVLPLLVHRYVEEIRRTVPGYEMRNVDLREKIDVATKTIGRLTLRTKSGTQQVTPQELRAPDEPGFFEVEENGDPRFTGAASFSDVREADLSHASPLDQVATSSQVTLLKNSEPDRFTLLWVGLLALALWVSWRPERVMEGST